MYMSQVSSRHVDKKVLLRIAQLLVRHVARVRTTAAAHNFLHDLFTETEQIMLAKRFAPIVMLEQGSSYQHIQKTLGVSSSTVARVWKAKQNGDFDKLLRQCFPHGRRKKLKRGSVDLVRILEVLLSAGLPPMGRGRWRRISAAIEQPRHR